VHWLAGFAASPVRAAQSSRTCLPSAALWTVARVL
jgi:hypothetical protein